MENWALVKKLNWQKGKRRGNNFVSFIKSAFPFGTAHAKNLNTFLVSVSDLTSLTVWFCVFWSFMHPYSKTEVLTISFLEHGEKEKGKREKHQMRFEIEQKQLRRNLLLNLSKMDRNMADVLKWIYDIVSITFQSRTQITELQGLRLSRMLKII